jgi:hypothetical protein
MSKPSMVSRSEFDALFIAPFASHRWESVAGRALWLDLQMWQDAMAGPLSAVVNSEGCEYAYQRDDSYFAGVGDPPALRVRLLEWHTGLAVDVEKFVPTTPFEIADLEFMRSLVSKMRDFLERACAVEQARWQAAKNEGPGAG